MKESKSIFLNKMRLKSDSQFDSTLNYSSGSMKKRNQLLCKINIAALWNSGLWMKLIYCNAWLRGAMDSALVFETRGCGFESHRGQ
jgi:transcription antitermination factor NusG